MSEIIEGFSKLNAHEKRQYIARFTSDPELFITETEGHLHHSEQVQQHYNGFAENTISNFYLPFNIAPNFFINEKMYHVPMVIEESSVVAAASGAAKFWARNGGFTARVIDNQKNGQVHFRWFGAPDKLQQFFTTTKQKLLDAVKPLIDSMEKRGGGIEHISLVDKSQELPNYYQLHVSFRTVNAMGANFINSVLEKMAETWENAITQNQHFMEQERQCQVIMSILSNYTPECLVECEISCPVDALASLNPGMTGREFAQKFKWAVDIANTDIYRATTHNKGIYNGIDAVVLATGNDFRAVEACGHAFAGNTGSYKSLNKIEVDEHRFVYTLRVPMALGTVGGITNLHPMVKWALDILGNPSADELMIIAASAGMANNFSAIKSLITKGIQHGHMRMHLNNMLNTLHATDHEKEILTQQFKNQTVGYSQIKNALAEIRNK